MTEIQKTGTESSSRGIAECFWKVMEKVLRWSLNNEL